MLKKIVHIKDDIFYSPSHNTFFRVDQITSGIPRDVLLEITGKEEKLFEYLLENPNQQVTKEAIELEFPEIADPYNKTLDRFRRDKIEGVLHLYGVLVKLNGTVILYLQESPFENQNNNEPPQVSLLLQRKSYYVDYDIILSEFSETKADNDETSIISEWLRKCKSLRNYDEKCLFILERLGFIPAFGREEEKKHFIEEVRRIVYRFEDTDVQRYSGTELLIMVRNLILCVTDYLTIQINKGILSTEPENYHRDLQKLLRQFQTVIPPERIEINPLILLIYHDYLGLVYYSSYKLNHNHDQLILAAKELEIAMQLTKKVDMHLQIWATFISFNLARVYEEMDEIDKAFKNYDITVALRQCLAESPFFSDSMKHDLYFEYLLVKIYYIDAGLRHEQFSEPDAQKEYRLTREELNAHYYEDSRGGNQIVIAQMLNERIK